MESRQTLADLLEIIQNEFVGKWFFSKKAFFKDRMKGAILEEKIIECFPQSELKPLCYFEIG